MMTDTPQPPVLQNVHKTLPRFASLRTITALVLREMSTTYGRSPGGYIWAVLEPALGLALLVALFSTGLRTPPLGTNFAIFYASGLMPFFTFLYVTNKVGQSVNFSRQLLAYPRVTILDAVLARFILTVLTQYLVSYLLIAAILGTMETRTVLVLPALLSAFAMAGALGLGIGILNAVLVAYYPVWQMAWAVMTRPLILISGVIFLHDRIPQPYRDWLWWNPLVHVTGRSRTGLYYSYRGEYVSEIYVYAVALICGTIGLLFLRRYYRDSMER
ncbi:ABC transporter permease [uncultured Tateyamaria sp.]|uniref:ABC transporter permease n=2 Tax=uncultured Tateyamaria sp. TaxID=455651 RepID=UPI002629E778|nr:ABC transporter permease [uncultured Tateyamaria sp.]